MSKTRNCRRTSEERVIHERATRIRKMTDAQLCEYLDNLEAGQRPAGPTRMEIITEFLHVLSIRTDTGLRISDTTIRKIKEIARQRGLLEESVEA